MQFVEEQTACIGDKTWEQLLPGVFGGSWQAVRVLGGFLTGAFVTGIAAILLAGDYDKLREMGQRWSFYENVFEALRGISRAIGRYLHAQCIIMGLVMLICTVGIWSSGTAKSPLLAGVGTGFLDALPIFGTGTVFVPWILILVIWQKRYRAAVVLAVTYGLCTLTRELLEPRLGGRPSEAAAGGGAGQCVCGREDLRSGRDRAGAFISTNYSGIVEEGGCR